MKNARAICIAAIVAAGSATASAAPVDPVTIDAVSPLPALPMPSVVTANGTELILLPIQDVPLDASPVAEATAPSLPPIPPSIDPDANVTGWARAVFLAATNGDYWILTGLMMLGLAFALRVWVIKIVPWFSTTLGGVVHAGSLTIITYVGLALAAEQPIAWRVLLSALTTTIMAAGLWQWLTKAFPWLKDIFQNAKARRAIAKDMRR